MQDAITKALMDNIITPIIVLIGSAILMVVRSYVKRIRDSIIAKNEMVSLDSLTRVKNNLLEEIETIVNAAVLTNMQLANSMKSGGKKLTDLEAEMLQKSTKTLVYQTLPSTLTDENGVMLQVIGGKERLDGLVNNFIEKAVVDAKNRMR
jgi:hypothetical protein|nr:MAG TPA: hypothetical protein [Caudoviricetes sp.]